MIVKYKGRNVEIVEINFGEKPEDTVVESAYYMDEMDDHKALLDEVECSEVQQAYAAEIDDAFMEHTAFMAERTMVLK